MFIFKWGRKYNALKTFGTFIMVKNGKHLQDEKKYSKSILDCLSPMGNHKLRADKLQVFKMSGYAAFQIKQEA